MYTFYTVNKNNSVFDVKVAYLQYSIDTLIQAIIVVQSTEKMACFTYSTDYG